MKRTDELVLGIHQLVDKVHKLTYIVYDFIRLYVLWCYEKNFIIENLDKHFIQTAFSILCIRGNRGVKPKFSDNLKKFYKEEYDGKIPIKKIEYINLSYVIAYQAIEMETMYMNNIQMHYYSHLKRYVKTILKIDTKKDKKNKTVIYHIVRDLLRFNDPYKSPDEYHHWINENRKYIVPEYDIMNKTEEINNEMTDQETSEKNKVKKNGKTEFAKKSNDLQVERYYGTLKNNYMIFLKNLIYMNRDLETFAIKNNIENIKLFQPIPRRNSLIPKSCTIDTNLLIHLFRPKNINPKIDEIKKEQYDAVWDNFFNLSKYRKGWSMTTSSFPYSL